LRAWQSDALAAYGGAQPRDFLTVATPGAGKTTFALRVAADLLARRIVERVTVVTPTEHLKTQWADAAQRAGMPLDPAFGGSGRRTGKDFIGVVLTSAGVAANPLAHRVRTERFRTLVVLDEIHHAGHARSWGDALREAFEPATRRLALTCTPFRSDDSPIPFVSYVPDEGAEAGGPGSLRSVADHGYGYADALRDGVVRPVLFLAYSGDTRWRTRAGDEVEARLGEPLTKDLTAQALRTALDPAGSWVPAVLRAADRRLSEVRQHVPDAGGLVIATDQVHARAYAKLLTNISGEKPALVLSDEKAASRRIADFADSDARWMVAVRMVSEGGRRTAAVGGGLCDHHGDSTVLRPGGRTVRAGQAPRRDSVGVCAERPRPAAARRSDGGRARSCARGPLNHRRRSVRRGAGPAGRGAAGPVRGRRRGAGVCRARQRRSLRQGGL